MGKLKMFLAGVLVFAGVVAVSSAPVDAAAPVAAAARYACGNCLENIHTNDDGYNGPFQVRCKNVNTGATVDVWLYPPGTPGVPYASGSYCWPTDPVTVVAVRISAGYKVRCTTGNGWWDYYAKPDGSWRFLGANEYAVRNIYYCVTQVA